MVNANCQRWIVSASMAYSPGAGPEVNRLAWRPLPVQERQDLPRPRVVQKLGSHERGDHGAVDPHAFGTPGRPLESFESDAISVHGPGGQKAGVRDDRRY